MTLLAFKIEAPDEVVTAADLAAVLPQALAFLLSFAVVANFWLSRDKRRASARPGVYFVPTFAWTWSLWWTAADRPIGH